MKRSLPARCIPVTRRTANTARAHVCGGLGRPAGVGGRQLRSATQEEIFGGFINQQWPQSTPRSAHVHPHGHLLNRGLWRNVGTECPSPVYHTQTVPCWSL